MRAADAIALLGAGLALAACGPARGAAGTLTVSSPDFAAEAPIPARFTCGGAGESPALAWAAPPRDTRSLAVLVLDPDAPGGAFAHWAVWGLPPSVRGLPEGAGGASDPAALPSGVREGRNGFGKVGYGGPCPPAGQVHRYEFHVYALDDVPPLPEGAGAAQLRADLGGHVLAQGVLVGRYGR